MHSIGFVPCVLALPAVPAHARAAVPGPVRALRVPVGPRADAAGREHVPVQRPAAGARRTAPPD